MIIEIKTQCNSIQFNSFNSASLYIIHSSYRTTIHLAWAVQMPTTHSHLCVLVVGVVGVHHTNSRIPSKVTQVFSF